MRRRSFIAGLGATATLALGARAQQAVPVVGLLRSSSLGAKILPAFQQGLKEAGFVEGQNVAVEFRSADNDRDRLSALAAEFVRRPVTVFVGNLTPALAAKAATKTMPIVFITGSDPVRDGLVASLNRPGGNVTGVSFLGGTLGAKRLELLHQLIPNAKTIGMLVNPNFSNTDAERQDVQAAAQAMGQKLFVIDVHNTRDIEPAFAELGRRQASAVLVGSGAFTTSRREQFVALAARHRLPASYAWREAVEIGGLMSYGTSLNEAYRQAGVYVGRILKGEKPGDLPVVQASKFEFVINLKTAKTLGLEFHPQLLATADEVIE